MQRIRIVAIDDHCLIRDAIRNNLTAHSDMQLVAEGVAGEDIAELVPEFHPDVLLLDQSMPQFRDAPMGKNFKVLPAIRRLRQEFPDVRSVILSAWADPIMIRQAVRAGVSGHISKSDANLDLAEAIRRVVRNGLFLSQTAHMAYAAHAETIIAVPKKVARLLETFDK